MSRTGMPGQQVGGGREVYGVPPATAVRGLGVATVGLAGVLLGLLAVSALDLPRWAADPLSVLLALIALGLLVLLVTALLRVLGRGARLILSETGFENRVGARVGVRAATWREVKSVRAQGRTLVIELTDGRQSLVNSALLDVVPADLADTLRRRLDAGHGYRPLS